MTLADFLMKRCGNSSTWEQAAAALEVQVSTLRWVVETVDPKMVSYFDRKAVEAREARAQRRASSPVPFPDEDEPRAPAPPCAPPKGRGVGSFPAFEPFEAASDDPYADVEVPGEAHP